MESTTLMMKEEEDKEEEDSLGLDSFHRQHDERGRTRAESDDFFPRVSKALRVLL